MNAPRFVCIVLLACVCCISQAQPARDPFAPATEPPPAANARADAPGHHVVHGILLLRGHALAALQTPAGAFRIVRVGDRLESAGAEVVRITAAGVHVRTATGVRRLPDTF